MSDSKQPRILVVDDEQDLREILVEQLLELDVSKLKTAEPVSGQCLIETAENGAEALVKAESSWFDAIVSDINMPVMDGMKFLGELRAHGKDTPFIFLTGFGDKNKAVEALRLGAMDFLDKPWSSEALLASVGRAVELGYQLRDLEIKLQAAIGKYENISEERRRQLRAVHRSILLLEMSKPKAS